MKKFAFSLEKLLRYKEQLLDVEIGVLSDMNAHLAALREELAAFQTELARASDELRQKYIEGITALEIFQHKTYIDSLGESVRQKRREIELQLEAIDRQTTRVREAKIELSTLEKLRERKREEYNYQAGKAEDLFIEEFVSNQRAASEIA